jgi:hypothetical protein
MPRKIVWLTGRGVSISCGLDWEVPSELYEAAKRGEMDREALCRRICDELHRVQAAAGLDTRPLDVLLATLRNQGNRDWKHAFVTTNWDTVLDEVLAAHPPHDSIDPVVAHINGSIEDPKALLTELDSGAARDSAFEANKGFQQLLKAQVCVVVGLSLRTHLDKELVSMLGSRQSWSPAGDTWLVVNHDAGEVQHACELLRERLPRSKVSAIATPFDTWVRNGLPELRSLGVIQTQNARQAQHARQTHNPKRRARGRR